MDALGGFESRNLKSPVPPPGLMSGLEGAERWSKKELTSTTGW
jgi:hypothetical protein